VASDRKTRQENRNEAECALPSQPPRTIGEPQHRTKDMNKLFSTAAIIAALASAVPASAQRAGLGPTANTGTGLGALPPGRVGPSSPLQNLHEESAGLPGVAPYPQRLALVRLLEVMALLDEAACGPTCDDMLRTPEATDEEFRALITKWRQERPNWRLKE
jgi:hypothetical protein